MLCIVISVIKISFAFEQYAIFENSGKLSVMPKEEYKQVAMTDLQLPTKRASLPCIVVVDGNISFSSLAALQKDIDWLYNQLNITGKKTT